MNVQTTIVILDDGETYAADATVVSVDESIMERVRAGEDYLLRGCVEAGVDAAAAVDVVLQIASLLAVKGLHNDELRRRIVAIFSNNKEEIFPPGLTPSWMG